ncbi:MAG: hypothetical protein WA970_11590 [Gammaproteobacteria bacterium]
MFTSARDQVLWERLNLVHPKGRVTPLFGENFAGGVEVKRAARVALCAQG